MQQGVRFKKCSEAIARMRAGGYNAEHLGLAADRLIASEFDGSPHDELLMHDEPPLVSTGQGDYVQDYTPDLYLDDRGVRTVIKILAMAAVLAVVVALMV